MANFVGFGGEETTHVEDGRAGGGDGGRGVCKMGREIVRGGCVDFKVVIASKTGTGVGVAWGYYVSLFGGKRTACVGVHWRGVGVETEGAKVGLKKGWRGLLRRWEWSHDGICLTVKIEEEVCAGYEVTSR